MKNTVISALAYLAGICDGARDTDGRGFSGVDTDFGKDLARKGVAYGLTERQHAAACRLVHKYRKQLRAAGYDVEALASEAWERPVTAAEAPARQPVAPWGEGGYARINRYAGRCCGCGARVEAGDGVTRKGEDGKWVVRCNPTCGQPEAAETAPGMRPEVRAQVRAIVEDATAALDDREARTGARWGGLRPAGTTENYEDRAVWPEADLIRQLAALENVLTDRARFPNASIEHAQAEWEAAFDALAGRPLTAAVMAALAPRGGRRADPPAMAPGMQPATQMVDGHRMAAGYNQPDEPMVRIRVVGPNGEALA